MSRRLYRSTRSRLVAGVCGGLGEYFGVDPVFVRLAFAAFILYKAWLGLGIYVLAALVIPEGVNQAGEYEQPEVEGYARRQSHFYILLAIGLILFGSGMLLYRFYPGGLPDLSWYIGIIRQSFWPLILILLGLWLIFGRKNK